MVYSHTPRKADSQVIHLFTSGTFISFGNLLDILLNSQGKELFQVVTAETDVFRHVIYDPRPPNLGKKRAFANMYESALRVLVIIVYGSVLGCSLAIMYGSVFGFSLAIMYGSVFGCSLAIINVSAIRIILAIIYGSVFGCSLAIICGSAIRILLAIMDLYFLHLLDHAGLDGCVSSCNYSNL